MPDAGNDTPVKRLIVEKDGPIGRIKMDNQTRRNAMTLGMWQDLGTAIEDFAADDVLHVGFPKLQDPPPLDPPSE